MTTVHGYLHMFPLFKVYYLLTQIKSMIFLNNSFSVVLQIVIEQSEAVSMIAIKEVNNTVLLTKINTHTNIKNLKYVKNTKNYRNLSF